MEKHIQEWWDSLMEDEKSEKVYFAYGYDKFPYQMTSKQITHIYNMEHSKLDDKVINKTLLDFAKGKTTKEETVEEAAKSFLKKLDEESGTIWTEDDDGIVKAFVQFASWQKEKDDELIKELQYALSVANNALKATYPLFHEWVESPIIEKAIEKANKHLNQ